MEVDIKLLFKSYKHRCQNFDILLEFDSIKLFGDRNFIKNNIYNTNTTQKQKHISLNTFSCLKHLWFMSKSRKMPKCSHI